MTLGQGDSTDTRPPPRRFWIARFVCALILGLYLVSRSGWEEISVVLAHLTASLGLVLAVIGALGRVWCSSYAAGNKNVVLLVDGPYSVTRNPLYFFSFVGGLGVVLATQTVVIPVLFAACYALYFGRVIRKEEAFLSAWHKGLYERYRARVPRFRPDWSLFTEPAKWTIRPLPFRRSLVEVSWFAIAAIVLHTLHDFRDLMGWPAIFVAY